jgi:hypothetical protein
VERESPSAVVLRGRKLELGVRPGTGQTQRHEILAAWYRAQVRGAVPPLLDKWQRILKVAASALFVRRMKTKWGSCNPRTAAIRLNTELAKKPPVCLEYVLVHELAHLAGVYLRRDGESSKPSELQIIVRAWTYIRNQRISTPRLSVSVFRLDGTCSS